MNASFARPAKGGGPAPAALHTALLALRPLRVTDVERDYDAVMSSRASLRRWSQSEWPAEDFPLAENRADLARHEREHEAGEAYTYTVVSPDGDRCLGCVYVAPLRPEEARAVAAAAAGAPGDAASSARVTFWVRDTELDRDLDRHLFASLRAWFAATWAFERLVFTAATGEARQQRMFADAGLVDAGACTLADGRSLRVYLDRLSARTL